MEYNIGDKVIIPLLNNQVGEVTGFWNNEYGESYYGIRVDGCDIPYKYFGEDLKPFTVPDITTEKEKKKKVLIVEEGSVDIDKLEEDGFYVIVYRQGAKPPIFLEV